jgi:hypothetical protein
MTPTPQQIADTWQAVLDILAEEADPRKRAREYYAQEMVRAEIKKQRRLEKKYITLKERRAIVSEFIEDTSQTIQAFAGTQQAEAWKDLAYSAEMKRLEHEPTLSLVERKKTSKK